MSRRIIRCCVSDEFIQGAGTVVGAAGSHNDVALRLEFGPMWEGLSRSIVWWDALGKNPVVTILTTDLLEPGETETYVVPIPAEPKAHAGKMRMTIKGVTAAGGVETSATLTTTAYFVVMKSDWDENAAEIGSITPTQAEQLQSEIDAIKGDIILAAQAADAAEAASASAAAAEGSAQKAQTAESDSKAAAVMAAESAQKAQKAQQRIENMGVSVVDLPAGTAATVEKTEVGGVVNLVLGIPQGPKGETGNVMYATFDIDPRTGRLTMHTPDGYTGPTFEINNGKLEVVVNG